MIRRKSIISCILISAITMTCVTMFPQSAVASEYSNYEDMNESGNYYLCKTATDKNGITWKYYIRNDNTISLWGTDKPKETMVVPSELDGYKVVKLGSLVQETDRGQSDYGVRTKTPKKVVISEGITEIGEGALNYPNLSYVELPSTIKIMSADSMNEKWNKEHKDSNNFVVFKGILVDGSSASGDVVIPNNIECIGNRAFFMNDNITSVVIPKNVKRIGEESFFRCKNLKKATIEEGTEVIGVKAFAECYNLKDVKIPETVTELGSSAFEASSAIVENTSDGELKIVNGVLLSGKDAKGDVVIPSGVTKISERAFYNNENITSVKIPETVTEIGKIAFAGSSIKSVSIPGSVKVIPESAFEFCRNLQDVKIADGVESISHIAFSECRKIKEMNLPASVTKIESGAFRGCSSLEVFNYGENIIVDSGAFLGTKFEDIVVSRGTVTAGNKSDNVIDADTTTGSAIKVETDKDNIMIKPYIVGWSLENGKWYYSKEGYERSTGWIYDNTYNSWFYLSNDGSMKTGWIYDNSYNSWFYLNSNGTMRTGWFYDYSYNSWFYLNPNGTMKTGWLCDTNGKWYYLYGNGFMAHNTWIGSYYVNSSGAWVSTR